jgi:farnesyl diphosphate synthase
MPERRGDPAPARSTLERRLAEAADLVTVALDQLLPRGEGPEARLTEAMRYAALGPGKRLRPYFALETARLFEVDERSVLRAACALECIHAYTLVHHDLPAMHDDATRRGRPTLHRQYDEATAILAGDALQTAAFEIMAHPDTHADGRVRADLVHQLAKAAGAKGTAGGQMIDLIGVEHDRGQSARMQRMKTGALIAFAFEIPITIARPDEQVRHALRAFALDLGIAYQIVDDLLDAQRRSAPSAEATGSGPGRQQADKATPPDPLAARQRIELLSSQCKAHLDIFGEDAEYLRESVDFVLDRRT